MKRLTLAKCYRKMGQQWHWMTLHPLLDKQAYFQSGEVEVRGNQVPICYCYACEYVTQHTGREARCSTGESEQLKTCPLKMLWPRGCCMRNSPFYTWQWADKVAARKRAALTIARECDRQLRKLKRKLKCRRELAAKLKPYSIYKRVGMKEWLKTGRLVERDFLRLRPVYPTASRHDWLWDSAGSVRKLSQANFQRDYRFVKTVK